MTLFRVLALRRPRRLFLLHVPARSHLSQQEQRCCWRSNECDLDEDVRMMKATGLIVVRIAESTWGMLEPKSDAFDFSHVDRVSLSLRWAS